jgi:hypothetical protein
MSPSAKTMFETSSSVSAVTKRVGRNVKFLPKAIINGFKNEKPRLRIMLLTAMLFLSFFYCSKESPIIDTTKQVKATPFTLYPDIIMTGIKLRIESRGY